GRQAGGRAHAVRHQGRAEPGRIPAAREIARQGLHQAPGREGGRMSAGLARKRVLVLGPALKALAEQALEGARIETAQPERAEALPALDGGLDLVLMDADAAGPELTREVIEALAGHPNAPGVLLIGAHLPAGLVRALLKLDRSDVLEAPLAAAELTKAAVAVLARPSQDATERPSRCW